MNLLSLPAGVRLQIWNRHLALRGRPNIRHGHIRAFHTREQFLRRHDAYKFQSSSGGQLASILPALQQPTYTPSRTSQPGPSLRKYKSSVAEQTPKSMKTSAARSYERFLKKLKAVRSGAAKPQWLNVHGFGKLKVNPPIPKAKVLDNEQRRVVIGEQPMQESYPDGAGPGDGPFDLAYLIEHVGIVDSTQYPHAPLEIFNPGAIEFWIRRTYKHRWNVDVPPFKRRMYKTGGGLYGCEIIANIPSLSIVSAVGEADRERYVELVASAHLLTKLHAKGVLRELFPEPLVETKAASGRSPSSEQEDLHAEQHSTEMPAQVRSAADTEEAFQSIVSPLRGDYQHAPKELFDLKSIAAAVHEAFQKAGIPWNVEAQTQQIAHKGAVAQVAYTLQIELPSGYHKTTTAQERNKNLAKSVAWAHMLTEFHTAGFLSDLFQKAGTKPTKSQAQTSPPEDAIEESEIDVAELVAVDKETIEAEKDAKTDIYNWAASFGLVPMFQARTVRKRKPGTRKQLKASQVELVEASIALPALGIHVVRVGSTLSTAETAAVVAFKQTAEAKQKAGDVQAADPNWSALNSGTATQFFDFYRTHSNDVYIELETDQCSIAGVTHNKALITINDRKVGEPVVMSKKTHAAQMARLTAAIEVVRAEPRLLESFSAFVLNAKGKILRDPRPVNTFVSRRALDMMRNGLVEARQAGLSDVRQTLTAETTAPEEANNRRRRPLPDRMRQTISKTLRTRSLKARRIAPNESQATLPMDQHQKQVLELVEGSLYSVIIGATGSGKTTQVPQIIVDDAIRRGEGGYCDVICTQPRRLAAISVASRVAAERNEEVGKRVGHHVRFDHKAPMMGGSITYCTTGILLEQLKYDADGIFDTTSHIIIDEVHERSLPIDFLMVLLKRAIKDRQAAGRPVPKVILMSATLDPELFAEYFAQDDGGQMTPAPILKVPGRTFPVQEKYVEEILGDFSPAERAALDAMADLDKGATTDYLETELTFAKQSYIPTPPVIDWKRENRDDQSEEDRAAAREKEDAVVPLSLVAATIAHISKGSDEGAILVFLPGVAEIAAVQDMLRNRAMGMAFDDLDKFKICPLHSALPPHEQADVLEAVPKGCRKVILSTNIAETSVTVPDVKYVVDSGKLRQKRYDQSRRITQLITTWESSSNARQRAGRAGRVRAGHYYALFTRSRRESMPASALPELLLSDLQEICLSVKAQGFNDSIESFLDQAIEPPSEKAVLGAIESLKAIEALTEGEDLTALGRVLSKLPVHPSLGKMIVLGIIFRCLDPIIILSSLDKDRSLFVRPVGAREEARRALQQYHKHSSDQLAFVEAIKALRSVRTQSGMHSAGEFARENFLHAGCFKSVVATAESIEKILIECGLVPTNSDVIRERGQYGGDALNRYSDNPALVKSIFLAGVRPNVAVKAIGKSKLHRTPLEDKVLIHPTSMNYDAGKKYSEEEAFLYAYESLRKTVDGKTTFIKDISRTTPLQTLVFGGKLEAGRRHLTMDDWLPFKIESLDDSAFALRLILEFRKALDRMLNGAFSSLSNVQEGVTIADDPIREGFVKATVAVLNEGEEKERRDSGIWVPDAWKKTDAASVA